MVMSVSIEPQAAGPVGEQKESYPLQLERVPALQDPQELQLTVDACTDVTLLRTGR